MHAAAPKRFRSLSPPIARRPHAHYHGGNENGGGNDDDVALDATGRLAQVQALQDVLRRTSLAELRDREIVEWLAEVERWLRDGTEMTGGTTPPHTRINKSNNSSGGSAEMRFLILGVLHTMPWWRVVESVDKAGASGNSSGAKPPSAARAAVTRWHRRLQLGFERVCLALIEQSQHTVPDVLELVMKPFRLQPPVRDGARRVIPCDSVVRLLNAVATRYSGLYVQDLLDQCLSSLIPRRRWPEARHHLACAAIFLHLALEGHVPGYEETLYVPEMEQLLQAASPTTRTTSALDSTGACDGGLDRWRLPPTATALCSRMVPVVEDNAVLASRRASLVHSARRGAANDNDGDAAGARSRLQRGTDTAQVTQTGGEALPQPLAGGVTTAITTAVTSVSVTQTGLPPSMSDTDGNNTTTTTIAGALPFAEKQTSMHAGPTLNNRMLSYRDELIHFVLQWLLEKELTLERHDTDDTGLGLSFVLGGSRSNSNASSPLGSSLLSRQSPHLWRTAETSRTTAAVQGLMRPARLIAMPPTVSTPVAAAVTPPTTAIIMTTMNTTTTTSNGVGQAQFPSTPPPPQPPAVNGTLSSPSGSQGGSNSCTHVNTIATGERTNGGVEEQFDEVARPFLRILQACTTLVFVKLAEDLHRQQTAGACGNAEWWRELLAFHLGAVLRIERPVCLLYLAPSLALLGTQEESVDMMHKLVSLITKGYMPVTQKPSFAARRTNLTGGNGRMMMMSNAGGSGSVAASVMGGGPGSNVAGHHNSGSGAQPVRMRMPPPMARAQSVSLPQRLRAALYLYPLFKFMRDRLGSAEGVRRRMLKWVAQEMRSYGVASRLVETLFAQCAAIAELLGLPLVAQTHSVTTTNNNGEATAAEPTDTIAEALQPLIEKYRLKSNTHSMLGSGEVPQEGETGPEKTSMMMHFDLQQMEFEGLLCPGLMDECPWNALLSGMAR